MAGAAIPPVVAEAFVAQNILPQNVYGMTENSSHQYTVPDDDEHIATKTCGRGGPAYEIRIFDPAKGLKSLTWVRLMSSVAKGRSLIGVRSDTGAP